ncbi:MAG: hypothetical protein KAT15_03995, partial [Bacteroidales bacterium]|nr:hypothetical protein [Bacteroidales bacterium]
MTGMKIKRILYHTLLISGIIAVSCVKIEPERIFKVETGQAVEITDTSWLAKGVVLDVGSQGISEHGFCYSTLSNPTVLSNDGMVKLGETNSTGEFTGTIATLDPGATYYLRAFLTNRDSTTYGKDYVFTTKELQDTPVVTTTAAASVTETSAVVGGTVTSDGGSDVTDRGIYYGTSTDPKTTGTKIQVGSGLGTFTTTLTGLAESTTYYCVAYAINS